MSGGSFQRRVALLRDAWAERRQMKGLASVHDFESQFRLLQTLHSWCESAASDVAAVYGPDLAVSVSPPPARSPSGSGFSVTVGDSYTLTFVLGERQRMGGASWFISVSVSSGGPGGAIAAAGPERRNGQWTRARLEDLFLSVLGAYERSLTETTRPSAVGRLRRRGA